MAESINSENKPRDADSKKQSVETEILNVSIEREGQHVNAKWGLHPHLKEELTPQEWKELAEVMGKVTELVGKQFSEVLKRDNN